MPKKEEVEIKKEIKEEDNTDSSENEDQEEDLNWWEQENLAIAAKGEKRWDTLVHNGVLFPPPYVPHGIPIKYEGIEFHMTPEEEEVVTMFACMREHDYYRNPIFRKNFFQSWRKILDRRGPHPITQLELCDFDAIYKWYLEEREKKKNRTKEEKKEAKLESDKLAEPYRYCYWDGKKEQVANFRVEPPGLFRGRGKHPLMGKLKERVMPEDITINIGKDAPIPPPPEGHRWGSIQHDNTVTWLATWRDSVLENSKYVMLAPSSTVKGQSDMMKFEKARSLKSYVDKIREAYSRDFSSSDLHVAQRAVAMYFIDKLALRVGNEKGSDEADTVGCCSLRVEHVTLLPDNIIKFDFLGKDSIRYQNEVQVLPQVYQLIKRFTSGKRKGTDIFDSLTTTQLNDHLKSFMPGLTAKVFRTYNASITLDKWFKEKPVDKSFSVADKLAYFNKANTEVAILCNHQKSVSKNHQVVMMQLTTKSNYTRTLIELLQRAKETSKKKSHEEAAKEFFAEVDKMQYDWLEAYGTEEQKAEYDEYVKNRSAPKERKSKSSSGKEKSSKSKDKSKKEVKKKAKKSKSKGSKSSKKSSSSSSSKGKGKGSKKTVKEEDSQSDDEVLADIVASNPKKSVAKKAPAKAPIKKEQKKPVKRSRSVVDPSKASSSEDDEDIPLSLI